MRIVLNIILAISVFFLALTMKSQTIIPGGYVSGAWDVANSPFIVQDDILIHPDSTLTIGEDVQILFSGPYMLEVQGQLLANGTPSQPVSFSRYSDTVLWHGIYFNTTDTSITDSSILLNGSISHCYQYPCLAISHSSRIRVSGFTVQYGDAFRGAGISCINSNPCFDDLLVQQNHALDGAGISLEASSPVLKNCTITLNAADGAGGGMVIFNSGNPYFEKCTFTGNQSFGSGGGIYINAADPVFVGCHITENEGAIGGGNLYSGGGVSVKLGANPFFSNCTFENNFSHREGGAVASFSVTKMVNCLFESNSAAIWGGGVYLATAFISSPVTNCTFSDNEALHGTALATHNHEAVVKNCIFWHENPSNPNSMIFLDSQFSWNLLNVAYSDLQNGEDGVEDSGTTQYTWGPGNIELDPEFLSGSAELSWQSPCIEAGTPDTTGLFLPELDLAGNLRLANSRVDMGAFEYQLPLIIQNSKFQIQNYFRVYPNPADDFVFVEIDKDFGEGLLQLINSNGQLILSQSMTDTKMIFDLSGIPAGFYLIKMDKDGISYSKRIIIQ